MYNDFIPLCKPNITEDDCNEVVKVLKSGNLVQGNQVLKLEDNIKKLIGVNHAIALSSGTATLHLALIALGIKPGDEIIIPSFTYVATANSIELIGAKPIFVDIDLMTFNINIKQIESKITSKTKAIMPVHEFGLACDIVEINRIAKKYNLHIIEDAACALGAKIKNNYVGGYGNISSFSFHPRKTITGGEGGVLVTNNDYIAQKLRVLRNHGISNQTGKVEFIEAGFNYRMTDIQAALINSQFPRLNKIIEDKEKLSEIYFSELKTQNEIFLPNVPANHKHSWQSFHILIKNRDYVKMRLLSYGIETNVGAQCIPDTLFYSEKYYSDSKHNQINSSKAYRDGLVLPLYENLSPEQIKYICKSIKEVLNEKVPNAW